jgi:hypothetical protein
MITKANRKSKSMCRHRAIFVFPTDWYYWPTKIAFMNSIFNLLYYYDSIHYQF